MRSCVVELGIVVESQVVFFMDAQDKQDLFWILGLRGLLEIYSQ